MNALVDVVREGVQPGDGWTVTVTVGTAEPRIQRMAAVLDDTGRRLPMPDPARRPTAGDTTSWDRTVEDLRALVLSVTERPPVATAATTYGRHVFESLLGQEAWSAIDRSQVGSEPVV